MEFYQLLDNYINEIGCSAKDLAEKSNISASVISRYRSGERAPSPDSEIIKNLALGLSILSNQNYDMILGQMITCLTSKAAFAKQAFYKIDRLVSELNFKQADIAKTFNYDASFISRVLSGQRFPANVEGFLKDIAKYVSQNVVTKDKIDTLSSTIFVSTAELLTVEDRYIAVLDWLLYDETPTINFLNTLDNFDYSDFLTAVHFSDIKMPSEPLQLPTTKIYIDKEQMKQGEIDFMKIASLARDTKDIYLYSDMTMEDMLDSDFPRMYMTGLAILVKKGLHLNVIHNLNRPINELLVGLETWVPLYMTGQLTPYYFSNYSDEVFNHLLYSAGSVALYGSSLYGQRQYGHYYLTKEPKEVAYLYHRAVRMAEMASPLMEIYRKNDRDIFHKTLKETFDYSDDFRNILSSPPISAMSTELLEKIVKNFCKEKSYSKDKTEEILNEVKQSVQLEKKFFKKIIAEKKIHISFHTLSEEEFSESPVYLPIGFDFVDINIPYTYETYLDHIKESYKLMESHPNITMEPNLAPSFKNIYIRMGTLRREYTDKNSKPKTEIRHWVLISKALAPSIHFMIKHPLLVDAISKIKMPITDK